jgi:hypothetical protein
MELKMAVIMTSETVGQTLQGYDGLFNTVSPTLKAAPGFVLHVSHPVDGGWRVVEIWETREDAALFFASTIAPNLPDGIRPKLTFAPLHDVLQPRWQAA